VDRNPPTAQRDISREPEVLRGSDESRHAIAYKLPCP
jgi:hypothetical protein